MARLHGVVVNYGLERPFDDGITQPFSIRIAIAHDRIHAVR
jgi:hypothetical protein